MREQRYRRRAEKLCENWLIDSTCAFSDEADLSCETWSAERELNPRIQVLQTRALATSPPARLKNQR